MPHNSGVEEPPMTRPADVSSDASSHLVQFYEDDAFLADAAADFIATALRAGEGAVVIATAGH